MLASRQNSGGIVERYILFRVANLCTSKKVCCRHETFYEVDRSLPEARVGFSTPIQLETIK
jgi:hypothetical protein